jgi:hypothetical protein
MNATAYTTYSYTSERGNRITIRRPVLTPEERAEQMEAIKKATVQVIIATEKIKQQKLKHKKNSGGTT